MTMIPSFIANEIPYRLHAAIRKLPCLQIPDKPFYGLQNLFFMSNQPA